MIVVTVTSQKRDPRTRKRFSWSYLCCDEDQAIHCACAWRALGCQVALAESVS